MPAEDDHGAISDLADRLGLADDEREEYVKEHMSRLGYKPRTVWEDNEDDENGGGEEKPKGFFKKAPAKKTAAPRTREVPDKRTPYGYS